MDLGSILNPQTGGSRAASANLNVLIDCNAPFALSFSSRNGGLRHEGGVPVRAPFRDLVAYTVNVDMPNASIARRAPCQSELMVGAPCTFSQMNTGGAEGHAEISLDVPGDDRPLLSGTFSDQLWLRVSPLIGGEAVAQSTE